LSSQKLDHEKNSSSGHDPDAIRNHLDRLLACDAFVHSQRSQSFLRYVVEETLAGRASQIKERNIGVDVFGRGESFDPQQESLVRVCGSDVRKRLSQAYETDIRDNIRIDLPVGSYCPTFIKVTDSISGVPEEIASYTMSLEPNGAGTARRSVRRVVLAITASIVVALIILISLRPRHPDTPLNALWNSFIGSKQPVLLALPAPPIYEAEDPPGILMNSDRTDPNGTSRLHRLDNYYTGVGACLAAIRFAQLLTIHQQQFLVRFGSDVSFADISQAPTIFLGGTSNDWSIQMTQGLRFKLTKEGATPVIIDTKSIGQRWEASKNHDSGTNSDSYALITILHKSESGKPMLIVSGLTARGTEAAANFLTDEDYFRSFVDVAPKDWSTKNTQIVLHSFIHGNSPGQPRVLAWYSW
jgi:hypothetical protein